MNATDSRDSLSAMYEAFGRGDIGFIVDRVADNVRWEYAHCPTNVPWLKPRTGKQGVRDFFDSLKIVDFLKFEPKLILGNGRVAVGIVDVSVRVRETGRLIEEPEEVHLFHFNAAGLVERFCHRVDSHAHWLAVQAC